MPDMDGPTVWIDRARMAANVRRLHDRARSAGIAVRAHSKGHRTREGTALQLESGAVGVSVAHAREAAFHIAAGAKDVVVAYPWTEVWRWERFAAVAAETPLTLHANSLDSVLGIDRVAERYGVAFDVRIDVRAMPGAPAVTTSDAVGLARAIDRAERLRLSGVTGYQGIESPGEAAGWRDSLRAFARALVRTAEAIREDGIACDAVCVGGTPAAEAAWGVQGVTEVCMGAYALLDAGMADLGLCRIEDVALWTESRADAVALVGDARYPWTSGAGFAVERDGRWLPEHVCAVVQNASRLRLADGDAWRVAVARDLPDAVPSGAVGS